MACACKSSSTKVKQVKQVSKSVRRTATTSTAQKRVIRRPAR